MINQRPGRQTFSYGGSRRQNDQIRSLQSASQAIQVGEAGWHADDGAASLVQLVQFLHVVGQQVAQGGKVGARVALADAEDQLLGFIQSEIGIALFVSHCCDLPGSVNETAQDSRALHNAPVIFDIAAGGHLVDERSNIAGPANFFQPVAPLQLVANSNKVCWLVALVKLQDNLINCAMGVAIEILGCQEIRYLNNCFRVDNDTAEDAALGLNILRQ